MVRSINKTKCLTVVKKPQPSQFSKLLICDWVVEPIEEHLRETGRHSREEAAFLAGFPASNDAAVATTAILPYTISTGGACELPLDVTARVIRVVKEMGGILLAQIHTHPGRYCDHSAIDDYWSIGDWPGFFSIVVPAFARFGLNRLFTGGAVIKERTNMLEWRRLPTKEIKKRFRVIQTSHAVI